MRYTIETDGVGTLRKRYVLTFKTEFTDTDRAVIRDRGLKDQMISLAPAFLVETDQMIAPWVLRLLGKLLWFWFILGCIFGFMLSFNPIPPHSDIRMIVNIVAVGWWLAPLVYGALFAYTRLSQSGTFQSHVDISYLLTHPTFSVTSDRPSNLFDAERSISDELDGLRRFFEITHEAAVPKLSENPYE